MYPDFKQWYLIFDMIFTKISAVLNQQILRIYLRVLTVKVFVPSDIKGRFSRLSACASYNVNHSISLFRKTIGNMLMTLAGNLPLKISLSVNS